MAELKEITTDNTHLKKELRSLIEDFCNKHKLGMEVSIESAPKLAEKEVDGVPRVYYNGTRVKINTTLLFI